MSPSRHQYPTELYDLQAPLAQALMLDGACLLDPEVASDREVMAALRAKLGQIRAAAMQALNDSAFQQQLAAFCEFLRQRHFCANALFQKTPSLRLYLPGALGTSWHNDHWYGHAPTTRTFWVPLSKVPAGAEVSFVPTAQFSDELERRLNSQQMQLADINRVCAEIAQPAPCEVGQYLCFDGRTLHGSLQNSSSALRCSIDFRGCIAGEPIGNKPISNYRLITESGAYDSAASFKGDRAVKYVNGGHGMSTKYQHILIESYAQENNLSLIRNEAEIETVARMPVLSAYTSRQAPDADQYDAIVVASMQCLPSEAAERLRLLSQCLDQGVKLHFAFEDKVFPLTASMAQCLHDCKAPVERPLTDQAQTQRIASA